MTLLNNSLFTRVFKVLLREVCQFFHFCKLLYSRQEFNCQNSWCLEYVKNFQFLSTIRNFIPEARELLTIAILCAENFILEKFSCTPKFKFAYSRTKASRMLGSCILDSLQECEELSILGIGRLRKRNFYSFKTPFNVPETFKILIGCFDNSIAARTFSSSFLSIAKTNLPRSSGLNVSTNKGEARAQPRIPI